MVAMLALVNIPCSSFLQGLYILFLLSDCIADLFVHEYMVMLDLESSQSFVK